MILNTLIKLLFNSLHYLIIFVIVKGSLSEDTIRFFLKQLGKLLFKCYENYSIKKYDHCIVSVLYFSWSNV